MWNGSISLPSGKQAGQNKNGFETETEYAFMKGIRAQFKEVTRSEQSLAQQKGYTADIVVRIMACNYQGQSFFKDEATGEYYDIRRTYRPPDAMTIELTGERRDCGAF